MVTNQYNHEIMNHFKNWNDVTYIQCLLHIMKNLSFSLSKYIGNRINEIKKIFY